jgi:hypothetical protein
MNPSPRSTAALLVLWFAGLQFIGFGVLALINPQGIADVVGFQLTSALAATEIRAFYGGLELALGFLLCAGGLYAQWQKPALMLQFACFLGIGVVRGISVLVSGGNTFLIAATATELLLAGLAFWAMRRAPTFGTAP